MELPYLTAFAKRTLTPGSGGHCHWESPDGFLTAMHARTGARAGVVGSNPLAAARIQLLALLRIRAWVSTYLSTKKLAYKT